MAHSSSTLSHPISEAISDICYDVTTIVTITSDKVNNMNPTKY